MGLNFDYPLLLEPIPVPRPWGGDRVRRLYRPQYTQLNTKQSIGEWWDVSTWPTDPGNPDLPTINKVTNGPLKGTLLDQIIQMPVVVKLLDSSEKLSVQVHPVSEDLHKDEMWYVLYAEPDAYLFCGLEHWVDPKEFCSTIGQANPDENEVLSKLRRFANIKPGAYFNVPTGTVHALGPGLVAFEISEHTQVTYRLFDYNRGRTLHLDEGCKALLTKRPDLPVLDHSISIQGKHKVQTLAEFPTFCVMRVMGKRVKIESAGHVHLITAIGGECKVTGPNKNWKVSLPQASTCVVPRTNTGYTIESAGEILISPVKDD
ncbi:MAG: class I mannose-6-phosphate isomerase [Armatimonadota bacterium]